MSEEATDLTRGSKTKWINVSESMKPYTVCLHQKTNWSKQTPTCQSVSEFRQFASKLL